MWCAAQTHAYSYKNKNIKLKTWLFFFKDIFLELAISVVFSLFSKGNIINNNKLSMGNNKKRQIY